MNTSGCTQSKGATICPYQYVFFLKFWVPVVGGRGVALTLAHLPGAKVWRPGEFNHALT